MPSDVVMTRPQTRRATIDDVAAAADVSRQTVSNVLRGRGRVGSETRERVLIAVQELHYRAHPGASSMRSRRTGQIAHPLPYNELMPTNAIMGEFIGALAVAAHERNYHLLLAATGHNDEVAAILELIRTGRADAFVLADTVHNDPRVALLVARGVPFACFGRTEPAMPQCWVDIDNGAAIQRVVSHLIDAGHRRIAFVGYELTHYWDHERLNAYETAMKNAGLEAAAVLTGHDSRRTREAIENLLDRDQPRSAIVCGSDVLAADVYAVANRRGLHIGSDLAVTGFDGSVVGRVLTPSLTTITIPSGEIARSIVARALLELEAPSERPGELLAAPLMLGDSA
jgi:DNA-binding LacI/PurR family transcriptional regulator